MKLQGLSSGRMQGFGSDCPPPPGSYSPAKINTTGSFKHSTDSDLLNMSHSSHSRERSRSPAPVSPRRQNSSHKTSEEERKPVVKKPTVSKLNDNDFDDWADW